MDPEVALGVLSEPQLLESAIPDQTLKLHDVRVIEFGVEVK